jgi:nucleoside-diphosphate-sugar epimerase
VIGEPITPFGKGRQKRGFIPLRDSMQCLTLAIENPPRPGEYRVFNQFEDVYDVHGLATRVAAVGRSLGLEPEIVQLENPRREAEAHYYNPDHEHLRSLGYAPTRDMETELADVLADLIPHRERILARRHVLLPDIRWTGERKQVGRLAEPHPAPGRPRAARVASGGAS